MSLWQDHKQDVVGLGIRGHEFKVSLRNGRLWGKRKGKEGKERRQRKKVGGVRALRVLDPTTVKNFLFDSLHF